MKTLILYYSYTGHAKRLALEAVGREASDVVEIKDVNRPGTLKAYTLGCFAAMGGKAWPIQPLSIDPEAYDRLILYSPVWAGNPPPAVYAALARLPGGKSVSVKMVSGSGKSQCRARIEGILKAAGCSLEGFEDIKA